jgi:hypothetical protein
MAKHVITAVVLGLVAWVPLYGQSTGTGTITGFVSDRSGALIPGAEITVTQLATDVARRVISNDRGIYVAPSLPVGDYEVKAELAGFKSFVRRGIRVEAESRLTVDIALEVGQISETVTVTDAVAPVQSETGEVSTLVSGTQVTELALNGRNFTQFLTLGPGVVSRQTGRMMGVGQEGNPLMSVHGGRFTMNKFTYDGTIAMDTGGNRGLNMFPPMEAIQEVKVLKSNYSAESGGYGHGIVNIVTRSGGKEFHGDLYEFFRNDALDARNFFASSVSPLKLNNFGYTLGGPFFIPGKYNTDKTRDFFFWSQSFAIRRGPQLVSFVDPPTGVFTAQSPSAAMRRGDLSEIAAAVRDPLTNQPFPNNQIPANRIDPNAAILLEQYYPLPNRAGAPNYAVTPSSATDWREELIRWDHHFTDRFKLTARYVQDTWEQEQAIKKPAPHAFATLGNFFGKPGRNLTTKLSNILGRAALNEFTYGFSMNRITNTPNPEATRPSALRIAEIFPLNQQNVIPNVSITGYGAIGVGGQLNNVNPVFTFRDDYSILVGRHSLKLGAEVIRTQKFSTSYDNMQGSFTFNGSRSGNAFADLLLGEAFNYTENEIEEKGYFFATDYEFYAQDDWKAGRDLTINYGLRYYVMEGGNGGAEKYDRISTFVPGLYDPAQALRLTAAGDLVAGTGDPMNGLITPTNLKGLDLPRSLKKTHFDVFGPRFGFAYSLPGGRATVLRGGYGLFYFWGENNNEGRQSNPPFGRSANIFTTRLSDPGAGTDRIFPPNVAALDVENLPPTIMHWSLGVQRELGAGLLAEVTYVGTRSYHLSRTLNINQPRAEVARSSGGANINTIRPYLGYGNLNYSENSAESKYHALEAHVLRRFSGGMLFQVAYTFSKGLADEGVQDVYDKRSAWGLFSLDRTHMLTLNFVYELPWLKTRTDALARVFGGWQLSGITTFQSGLPLTVTAPGDRTGTGAASRPNLVSDPNQDAPHGIDKWFNTEAFVLQPVGFFGNAGSNIVRGPGIASWDLNVFKNIRLSESSRLQFGAEFYNAFNHAQFEGVGSALGTPTFGFLTSARDPRTIQFRVKVSY